ncbi:hypothetical protein RHGRI_034238 [Rhododendron griersonianum]|uniref:Uncharacterized protein n=1 Tax=Rhododendron griersonianum TaxID=479676 RepID=A0AAV6I0N5_9ERIC|nr:hypothetical protein RHGRI_034238 [Rhododendron griersonianum]
MGDREEKMLQLFKRLQVANGLRLPKNPLAHGCGCKDACKDPNCCACAKLNGSYFPYVDSVVVPILLLIKWISNFYWCCKLHLEKGLRVPKNPSVPRCGCKDACIDLTVALVLNSMDRIFLMLHEAWWLQVSTILTCHLHASCKRKENPIH